MDPQQAQEEFGQIIVTASDFRKSRVLTTAVNLAIFDRFINKYRALDEVLKPEEDPDALMRLCNALVGLDLLRKKSGQFMTPPPIRSFLTDKAEHDLRPMIHLMEKGYETWWHLEQAMYEGQSIELSSEDEAEEDEEEETPRWDPDFIAAMEARAYFSKQEVAAALQDELEKSDILDLGGGSGVYLREMLKQEPTAQGVLGDLPHVIEEAEKYVEPAIAKRMFFEEIDVIEDRKYGISYDLIFASALIHIFGPQQNQNIILKSYNALKEGGKLVILDYIMDKEKIAPPHGTLFGLHMLLNTKQGNVYSKEEITYWMEEAGFHSIKELPLNESAQLLMAEK